MHTRKPLFLAANDFVRRHSGGDEGQAAIARSLALTLLLWCALLGPHFMTTVMSVQTSPVLAPFTDMIQGLAQWNQHRNWDQVPTTGFLIETLGALALFGIVSYLVDPVLCALEASQRSHYEARIETAAPDVPSTDGPFARLVRVLCLMPWSEFETFVAKLLQAHGFKVTHTHAEDHILAAAPLQPKLGADLDATKGNEHTLVQCRAWTDALVPQETLEDLKVRMDAENAHGACYTLLGFTEGAQHYAQTHGIELNSVQEIARKFFTLSPAEQDKVRDTWSLPVAGPEERRAILATLTRENAQQAIRAVTPVI